MFLMDNDAFNLIVTGDHVTSQRVRENAGRIWLSSIAAEELLVGRLSGISRARSPRNSLSIEQAHRNFVESLESLRRFPLLVYSESAEAVFETFTPATIRIGPQDCRIAAQAIAAGLTVITRNLRDFEAIGVPCADWSARPTSL